MSKKALENALANVNEERRGFLKKLLIGSAAVAVLPLMTSSIIKAQEGDGKGKDGDGGEGGEGKGKGKGGKGKGGKGKGKGDGEGGGAPAGN